MCLGEKKITPIGSSLQKVLVTFVLLFAFRLRSDRIQLGDDNDGVSVHLQRVHFSFFFTFCFIAAAVAAPAAAAAAGAIREHGCLTLRHADVIGM